MRAYLRIRISQQLRFTQVRLAAFSMMFAVFLLTTSTADAGPISFFGVDPGANSTDPRPTSNSAAASFDAAASQLGVLQIITFESAPVSNLAISNLPIAPGVFLSATSHGSGIVGPQGPLEAIIGYNTTSGGTKFALTFGGAFTMTFDTPIFGFGAYVTGINLSGDTITFNDGSFQTIAIPNPGLSGGVAFVGFTDAGTSISSITLTFENPPTFEIAGIDDVRTLSATPEPISMVLFGTTAAGLGLARWYRRRRREREHAA